MSKHPHEPDHGHPSDRPRSAPATGDTGDTLPNRTANTSLTNPGPPPGGGTGRQGAPAGDASGDLPNRTANTSLTDPGPPPENAVPGQFGEVGQTAQGTDLTAQMESAGPSSGNVPGGDDLIPWDPTGKIDDEVERRYRKPPAAAQPPAASPQPGGTPGPAAPPSGTLPRGDTSGNYPGPITTPPADPGATEVRTLQDVRPAPVPAHGAHDTTRHADGGADEPPAPASGKASNKTRQPGHRPDPGGYGEVQ